MDYNVFNRCDNLIIYCEASSKPYKWDADWNYSNNAVYWGVKENQLVEIDNIQYVLNFSNKIAIASKYSGESTELVMPTSIEVNDIAYKVTTIGDFAFKNCDNITSIILPTGLISIGKYAFYCCKSLTSIEIPTNVRTIYESAFSDCYSLTSIIIPNSVTRIGNSAFEYCYSLTIYCESTSTPSGWDSSWNPSNRPVYFGVNENNFVEINNLQYILDLENNTAIISRYTGIEETVEILSTITHNNIEYNVTSIGNSAFEDCDSLTSIVIPNSVTSIGNSAFEYCYSLTSIVIPNSVTSIGNSAFKYCNSLTIYCESTSEPSGWDSDWNLSNRPVVFGYIIEE